MIEHVNNHYWDDVNFISQSNYIPSIGIKFYTWHWFPYDGDFEDSSVVALWIIKPKTSKP